MNVNMEISCTSCKDNKCTLIEGDKYLGDCKGKCCLLCDLVENSNCEYICADINYFKTVFPFIKITKWASTVI